MATQQEHDAYMAAYNVHEEAKVEYNEMIERIWRTGGVGEEEMKRICDSLKTAHDAWMAAAEPLMRSKTA